MPKTGQFRRKAPSSCAPRDHRILKELSRDGRLSNVELARRVRMSESACLRRVRALEDSGAITGYRATVNPLAFGKVLSAYMLGESGSTRRRRREGVLDVMRADERIITCAAVTGEYDLILEVAVKDVTDLTDLTLDTLLKLPTVRDVVTCLSLRTYKTAGEVGQVF